MGLTYFYLLREFAAMQTSRQSKWKEKKKHHFLGETDRDEDQSKDILNSVLGEELSDSDFKALIVEAWADVVLLLKRCCNSTTM